MPSELLQNLMEQADGKRLVLPDFQRDFVWKPSDTIKLVASLLNGYPIGGLLLMESQGIYGQRPIDGVQIIAGEYENGDTRLILDGQQRLTSCYRTFVGGVNVERHAGRYYLDYKRYLANPNIPNSEVEELINFIRQKDVDKNFNETTKEQAAGMFPLDIILRQPRGVGYSKWLSDYAFSMAAGDKSTYDKLSQLQSDFIRRFLEKITGYQIHYEEIKKGTSSDVICTVFETINTTGKRLTVYDLLVARCFPHGMNLREMLEEALDRAAIGLFDPDGEDLAPIALPRIIALKDRETARRSDILELKPETIKSNWDYAVNALDDALTLMTERYGCFGARFVPLADMIAPMAVIIASEKFKQSSDNLQMLDRWYWRSVFSQYYISATETKIQRTVRQWLGRDGEHEGWLDNAANEPDSVKDFSFQSSILDDVSRADNAIYRGVMSLLLSHKVTDFGTDRRSLAAAPWEEIDDHHIYPKQFLGPYGIKGDAVNNIANRTPILRKINQQIGNLAPHVYLADPNLVGAHGIDDLGKQHQFDPHLACSPFTADLYRSFIADRSKKILDMIGAATGADPVGE